MRWHETVDRYKESELRNTRKLGSRAGNLAGLGTSAARIAARLRQPTITTKT